MYSNAGTVYNHWKPYAPRPAANRQVNMNPVVFEHVKVAELREDWRRQPAIPADAYVTVRIEADAAAARRRSNAARTRPRAALHRRSPLISVGLC